jgi:hypothetical protein
MRSALLAYGLALTASALLQTTAVFGQSNAPTITSATANFAVTPAILTINGQNLGSSTLSVTLGLVTLNVLSSSPGTVVAELPASISPGSYALVVLDNANQQRSSVRLDVTLGAGGTAGPQGPPGPQGPRARQDPKAQRDHKARPAHRAQ